MKFKYALFDLDMTLIDSIIPLRTSANLLAGRFGLREVTYEEVYQAEVSGPNCTFESLWTALWGYYDPQWYEVYRDHLTDEEYAAMELFPTGRETLETLYGMKVPLGLASNRDYPRKALKSLGIEHLFRVVVGQFDVVRPKPDPEMILKAVELLQAPRDEVLYICDSRGDLTAAGAGGVKTFALTTGGHSAEELLALGAWKTGDRLIEVVDLFH
jgi:HAD superfamily hydrolase (TIGR01509 family)